MNNPSWDYFTVQVKRMGKVPILFLSGLGKVSQTVRAKGAKRRHFCWKRRFYDNFMFVKRQSFDHGAFLLELDIEVEGG
jgi:hypothetical protein